MKGRPAGASLTTMTNLMGVGHANSTGFVHGGEIMKMVDNAAGVAGMRHARGRVVTAQVDSLSFLAPVHVGDLLSITAIVTEAWSSSMEVEVTVRREDPTSGEGELTTRAHLTMVAVDQNGRPVSVPPLEVSTETERRRQSAAGARRAARMALREQLDSDAYDVGPAT